ncbi:MAG: right-handed parallel beta-helix repeat-containing protein, partial [bacterium]|nr:right-handed parallel beta-helix repeat-containing protein [bacterium]
DEWDNRAGTAQGYVGTLTRALTNGWNKATVGSHIVRNNHIHNCEQAGIVGSLGCSFSTVEGNIIHDIYRQKLFSGAEMSGIKLHGSIDVVIRKNHIYRSGTFGIWLDWMAQGTQVTCNLLHDNDQQDIFMEVNHGPYLIANNIMLSRHAAHAINSRGGAYAHNLVAGVQNIGGGATETPYLKAHSTEVVGLHDCPVGDVRWLNNVLFGWCNLNAYDQATLPVNMAGNVFLKGSTPGRHETAPLLRQDFDPGIAIVEKADGWYLEFTFDSDWKSVVSRNLVTSEMLGRAQVPDVPFENRDGSPINLDSDY